MVMHGDADKSYAFEFPKGSPLNLINKSFLLPTPATACLSSKRNAPLLQSPLAGPIPELFQELSAWGSKGAKYASGETVRPEALSRTTISSQLLGSRCCARAAMEKMKGAKPYKP